MTKIETKRSWLIFYGSRCIFIYGNGIIQTVQMDQCSFSEEFGMAVAEERMRPGQANGLSH